MKLHFNLLGLILVVSSSAFGQDIYVKGVGGQSCDSFTAAVSGNAPGEGVHIIRQGQTFHSEARLFAEWLQGFITAINLNGARQITTDFSSIELWMRNWCQANPTKMVFDAIQPFVNSQTTRD